MEETRVNDAGNMSDMVEKGLVWFRRDLRVTDHAALYHALQRCRQVFVVFVYETELLRPLPRVDRRVEFIQQAVTALDQQLWRLKNGHATGLHEEQSDNPFVSPPVLIQRHGQSVVEIPKLAHALGAELVFANHDDEPFALQRDKVVSGHLADIGVGWNTFKDHVIFERRELLTQSAQPYTVFTPYKNAWLKKVTTFYLQSYSTEKMAHRLAIPSDAIEMPRLDLAALGFQPSNLAQLALGGGSSQGERLFTDFLTRIDVYDTTRDYPAIKGPSYLGLHLRFGTVSVRRLARQAWLRAKAHSSGAAVWLNEIIWRDFYAQIMANFPHVIGASFKPAYDKIEWEKGAVAQQRFAAWCNAETGYPLVDAAMHQLNQTGYMHNRLRMVTASFLCKHLGVDWRWGEAYFAEKLNDFDLASNNGGWQWASSSGCDAQPYFRIFNPVLQSKKFDPDGQFIVRYLPALAPLPAHLRHTPWLADGASLFDANIILGHTYPKPIVDHAQARAATLLRYRCVNNPAIL